MKMNVTISQECRPASLRNGDDMNGVPFQIVLVEDAEPDVFLVREALVAGGVPFNLHVLGDGEKAVDFIDEIDRAGGSCPHLLLLDLNLPKKSGAQVLEHVKQSRRLRNVPVVVLTSSDSPRDKEQAALLGATRYFRKPSRLAEFMKLGEIVRDLLGPERSTAST
jgi:chemotaxis family two-component system response regulator Rcp1